MSGENAVDDPTLGDGTGRLLERVEANSEDLVDLLDLLVVVKALGDDLGLELKEAAADSREPIEELRSALESEDTLRLLRRVGDNADTLVDLIDLADVADDLAADLVPELKAAAVESRGTVGQLRTALEDRDTIVLLRRLGDNTDTFIDLLDVLEATEALLRDLLPELKEAVGDSRSDLEEVRLVAAGFAEARGDRAVDPYEVGRNLGNMLWLAERLGDPAVTEPVDAGLTAFTDDRPAKRVGFWGLLGSLRNADVQRGLGTLIEFLRRMGARMDDRTHGDR